MNESKNRIISSREREIDAIKGEKGRKGDALSAFIVITPIIVFLLLMFSSVETHTGGPIARQGPSDEFLQKELQLMQSEVDRLYS